VRRGPEIQAADTGRDGQKGEERRGHRHNCVHELEYALVDKGTIVEEAMMACIVAVVLFYKGLNVWMRVRNMILGKWSESAEETRSNRPEEMKRINRNKRE
jgi:hypothetical protein